tara:strand:- start:229 stop:399 length:171 start_codon:yes stop_codon:yes gene_type:complete
VKPAPSSFFHEKQSEEEELLKLSLKESRRAKKERENIKWKVKPTHQICGEQDDKSI